MYTSSSEKLSHNSHALETRNLPKKWEVRFSKRIDKGRPYYVNLETRKSQWKFPGEEKTLPQVSTNPKYTRPERVLSVEEIADINRLQDAQNRTR
jgi:hypothetical protein